MNVEAIRHPEAQAPRAEPATGETDWERLDRALGSRVQPRNKKGSVCLFCNRYRVTATVVGGVALAETSHAAAGRRRKQQASIVVESISDFQFVDLYGTLYDPKDYAPVEIAGPGDAPK